MIDLGKIGYKIEVDDSRYEATLRKMEKQAENSANSFASTVRKAFAALGGFFAFREGVQAMRRFSDELANIKTIAQEYDTARLRKEITNLSSTLGTSAELANALYFAYSAGVRGSEKEMARFVGQIAALAKTIGAQVTPTMDAVTTMMNAYGLKVKDAGMLTDWFYQIVMSGKTTGPELAQSLGQIAATAAASGISLDELGAALATLTTTMPTNIAVTSLAASIRSLMNPTDDVRKQAAALGIDLSMAAIKARGFGGVMDEIYRKTQGRGDLIGKLFPAESSRAIMALAGTQLDTLKQNIVDFGNKGGAAANAFNEKMKSDDEQLKAFAITGQKILTEFVNIGVELLTASKAAGEFYEKITGLSLSSVQFLARLMALVTGTVLLHKALGAISAMSTKLQKGFIDLAVRGGYEPPELQEEKARLAEEASLKRREAIREAATARQLMRDKQEIASAKARAVAVEQANLQELRSQNERNRYQYTLRFGNSRGYAPDPALAESEKRLTQLTREQATATREAELAQASYTRTRAASVATVRTATAAHTANTAATRANAAATGLLTRAKLSCMAAVKGLWAAMLANPLTSVIVAVSLLAAIMMKYRDSQKQAAEAELRGAERAEEKIRQNKELRKTHDAQIQRLEQLTAKQSLSSTEQAEAQKMISSLEKTYGKFGVTLDKTTGKLAVQAGAFQSLRGEMEKITRQEQLDLIKSLKRQEIALETQFIGKGGDKRIGMLSDSALEGLLSNRKMDGEGAELISRILEARSRRRTEEKKVQFGDESAPETPDDIKARIAADAIAARQRVEAERELALLRQRNALAADGELSKADEQALIAYELNNQMERLVDLKKDAALAEATFGTKSKEHLAALNEQEKAQAKIYELENRQRQGRIDLDNEKRSYRQQLEMNTLIVKLRQDGEYSISDQIEVQRQKLKNIAENIKAAQAQMKGLTGDARMQMELKLSQLGMDQLMAKLDLQQLRDSGLKSNGNFSAELLNFMSGAQAPQQETAENTRKNLYESRKIRENLSKATVLKYGSK